MLQSLLAERFKLKAHHETKELPVYALTPDSKGTKLIKATKTPGGFPQANGGPRQVEGTLSMESLADMLSSQLDRPAVDFTEIRGLFEVNLKWTPASGPDVSTDSGSSIFSSIREQLGLKLSARKAPVDVLVVDSVEKIPTEN